MAPTSYTGHPFGLTLVAVLATACGPVPDEGRGTATQTMSLDGSQAVEVIDGAGTAMGSIAFETSCEGEGDVRLGLALLHHMTYAEAARVFERLSTSEPECAVAPWGIAMSYLHPLWPDVPTPEQIDRGLALIEEARALGTASPREAAYIDALDAYYVGGNDRTEAQRLATYKEAWDRVAQTYPEDPEAALFSALSTIAVTAGFPDRLDERVEAGLIAERVLEVIPDHPGAHHYVIHAYDIPSAAERALPVARNYGRVAPANSHALHMTSHIFTQRGLWEESVDFNQRAADVAWGEPIAGQLSGHHLHAIDYLAYAHLQRGADDEVEAIVEHLRSLDGPVVNHTMSAYAFAAVPARFALERHAWPETASLQPRVPETIPWDSYPFLEAIPVFASALGAALTGDLDTARADVERLVRLEEASGEIAGAYDWATQVRVQHMGVSAWIAYVEGRSDEGIALMTEAADLEATTEKNPVTPGEVLPAGELLGDMLLDAGRPAEAFDAYTAAMQRTPNRFNSLYGAARAAEGAGMTEEATDYYRRLLTVAGASTSRTVQIRRAQLFAEDN